jgi:dienelactone hydrolase
LYYSLLDAWDERRAQHGSEGKTITDFVLGAKLGFSGAKDNTSIAEFCELADQAVSDPFFFEDPCGGRSGFECEEGWVKFPSGISTEIKENNIVWAKVTESSSLDHALVVFHHWNASGRNRRLANFFSKRGITVVEIALPYHFERRRPGSSHADFILSPNIGRTVQSIRQAVWDGRKLIRCLKLQGYEEISVLGMSLGSWVAGLVAAYDPSVSKASLFLAGGSFADFVWTGRATQKVRESLEPAIALPVLRKAWGPINLENYVDKLSRPDLNLQIVLAKRDKVVLPDLSKRFVRRLKDAGAKPNVLELNCGHYSLALPPYNVRAGLSLKRFLKHGRG